MGLEKIYGGKTLDGNLEDFERKSVYDERRQASIDEYYDRVIEARRKSEQKAQLKQTIWSRIKNKYTSMTNENSTDEIIQAAGDLMQNSHRYSYYGDYMMEFIDFDGNPYENDRRTMAQYLKTLLVYKYNETIEHIELPENEQTSTRIHQKIEELEKFGHLPNSHKDSIAQIQGLESKELFSLIDTFQKKSVGAFARPSLSNMQEINSQVSKRLEYLESKLSILMENKEIDGNEERIADIEKQISSIRGVWTEVVRSNTEKILTFQANNRRNSQISENLIIGAQTIQVVEQDRIKEQLCGLIGNENLSERFEAEEQARLKAEQEARERAEEQARLKAEQEAKEIAEEKARLRAEQEAKERAEEQARLKAEQEEKERAEEQARLKAEQEEKERAEEQARLKAEQEAKEIAEEKARLRAEQEAKEREEELAKLKAEKERQESIEKDIIEYEQYEELISRKPELDKLLEELRYEDFSAAIYGYTSERMGNLLNDLKKLPENERKIILQQYNKIADLTINEQGQIIKDGVVQDIKQSERKDNEQESTRAEQVGVETSKDELDQSNLQFTKKNLELDFESMIEADLEYMRTHQTQQPPQVDQDYWNKINLQQAKVYEQQQPEKIRPREEYIRDESGDIRDKQSIIQMQEVKNPTIDLWMNRFSSWYNAIDRVSQNVKEKFVKMKSDIVNVISDKIKERMNKRQTNIQEQDSNER